QPIRKTVTPEIPDKLYFRIGDVARLCEVPAYVLRFWETEFPQLKPNKGGTGQRLYRKRDVEMALRIKSLLYDQGYTIPGARQVFKTEVKVKESAAVAAAEPAPVEMPAPFLAQVATPVVDSGAALRRNAQLRGLRDEMQSLLKLLSKPAAAGVVAAGKAKPSKQPEETKVQSMRPRLVVEPKPAPKPEPSRMQIAQRDLFAFDSGDSPE
ncbi:MAG TPA: MerR family transcriptional regulator, partial [Acidobacteriaceae bacterium]